MNYYFHYSVDKDSVSFFLNFVECKETEITPGRFCCPPEPCAQDTDITSMYQIGLLLGLQAMSLGENQHAWGFAFPLHIQKMGRRCRSPYTMPQRLAWRKGLKLP